MRTPTILVVDDEALIRYALNDRLTADGYRVVEAETAADAILPILTGLSTNTISKLVLAATSGGRSFTVRVIPGLILVALAAWVGALSVMIGL